MKALTIRQPWATLIALGVKTIETRSWRAPKALIGQRIAIHAGATRGSVFNVLKAAVRDLDSVHAWDSSTVTATAYVAVHLHSGRAKVEGGRIIDVSALDLTDPDIFAAYAGGPLLIADDGRGYRLTFRAGHYEAGCRCFTHAEAVDHWSNPEHDAPKSAALLLAAVEAHHGATS